MAQWDLVVALWNRDTEKRQLSSNDERLADLKKALAVAERQFARILKPVKPDTPTQPVAGLFVAPEYFFAANKAGLPEAGGGGFNTRCVSEKEKDGLVNSLLAVSKQFKRVILIPGTIAWWASLDRAAEDQYVRNQKTYQPTAKAHPAPRRDLVLKGLARGHGRGARIATPALEKAVRELLKAPPPSWGIRPLIGGLVNPRVLQDHVSWFLRDDIDPVTEDVVLASDQKLRDWLGRTDGFYRETPSWQEAYQLVATGRATRMMKNTAFVMLDGTIRFKYNKANDFHEALSDDGATVFCPGHRAGFASIEGIKMGIEICLDHAAGELSRAPLPAWGRPMLHIVTSASVKPISHNLREGGYFVHASSQPVLAGVSRLDGGVLKPLQPVERNEVGGDPLDVYVIRLEVS